LLHTPSRREGKEAGIITVDEDPVVGFTDNGPETLENARQLGGAKTISRRR
jgi:hypothetical protein